MRKSSFLSLSRLGCWEELWAFSGLNTSLHCRLFKSREGACERCQCPARGNREGTEREPRRHSSSSSDGVSLCVRLRCFAQCCQCWDSSRWNTLDLHRWAVFNTWYFLLKLTFYHEEQLKVIRVKCAGWKSCAATSPMRICFGTRHKQDNNAADALLPSCCHAILRHDCDCDYY